MPYYTRPDAETQRPLTELPSSNEAIFGAAVESAFQNAFVMPLERFGDIQMAQHGFGYGSDMYGATEDTSQKYLSAEEANKQGELVGLKPFTGPVTTDELYLRMRYKHEENKRNEVLASAQSFGAKSMSTIGGMIGFMADPIGLAASMLPISGVAAKGAALIGMQIPEMAAKSAAGIVIKQVGKGLVEGAGGNILMEPGLAALAASDQRDYSIQDAMTNIFYSSIFSGVAHGIGAPFSKEMHDFQTRAAAAGVENHKVAITATLGESEAGVYPNAGAKFTMEHEAAQRPDAPTIERDAMKEPATRERLIAELEQERAKTTDENHWQQLYQKIEELKSRGADMARDEHFAENFLNDEKNYIANPRNRIDYIEGAAAKAESFSKPTIKDLTDPAQIIEDANSQRRISEPFWKSIDSEQAGELGKQHQIDLVPMQDAEGKISYVPQEIKDATEQMDRAERFNQAAEHYINCAVKNG